MSVDKSNPAPSTGIEPGDRKPTVIGIPVSTQAPHTPTVMGTFVSPPPQGAKPTIIGSGVSTPTQHMPSVIGTRVEVEGGKPKAIPQATTIQATVTKPQEPKTVDKPSVMPGTIRNGLEVTLQELEKAYPGNSRETLNRVLQILKGTIVETLRVVTCSQWGQSAQEKYQELVKDSLEITSKGEARDGTKHLSRLYTILEEIVLLFQNQGSKGLKFWEKKQTPWEKYLERQGELDQLRQYLGQILPTLRDQQRRIEEINDQAQNVSSEIDAYSIAAQYVADTLGPAHELSGHLLTQSMSLTKMIAQIQDGTILREAHGRAIDSLADRIQDGVLITLPGWIEHFSLISLNPSMSETDNYSLRQSLEDLVIKLK